MQKTETAKPYTYGELAALCTHDGLTFLAALSALLQVGASQVLTNGAVLQEGLVVGELKANIEEAIARLATTPQPIILAVIQRALPPVTDKDMLPPLQVKDEEYVCPVCGAELIEEDQGRPHFWMCRECGASGTAVYGACFKQHTNVLDGDGNPAR